MFLTRLKIGLLAYAIAAMLFLPACASLQALPSVQDKDNSPRAVGMLMQEDFGPALKEVADACEGGLLSDGTRDIIAEYGPTIRQTIGLYASTARSCVVVDGRLTTDPAAGDTCFRGSVQQASAALPSVLKEAGMAIGGDKGKQLYMAGLVATTFIGDGAGGVIEGFKKVEDVPLEAYDAGWAPVQADADRLAACAAAE